MVSKLYVRYVREALEELGFSTYDVRRDERNRKRLHQMLEKLYNVFNYQSVDDALDVIDGEAEPEEMRTGHWKKTGFRIR